MTVTSMARPLSRLQLLMETSPGRDLTRFRTLYLSPDLIHLLAKRARRRRREHRLTQETGNGSAKDFGRMVSLSSRVEGRAESQENKGKKRQKKSPAKAGLH